MRARALTGFVRPAQESSRHSGQAAKNIQTRTAQRPHLAATGRFSGYLGKTLQRSGTHAEVMCHRLLPPDRRTWNSGQICFAAAGVEVETYSVECNPARCYPCSLPFVDGSPPGVCLFTKSEQHEIAKGQFTRPKRLRGNSLRRYIHHHYRPPFLSNSSDLLLRIPEHCDLHPIWISLG